MSASQRSETITITVGRLLLLGAGLVLLLFLGMQLLPAGRDNPPVIREPKWDSPETRALAKRACFDCHSNETVWPWYSYVAPVSWAVAHNVQEGRARLNFSEWGVARGGGEGGEGGEGSEGSEGGFEGGEGGGETGEAILNGSMPPADYVAQHPTARLTDAEKQQLIKGLEASLSQP
jgi:uncharacterized membrane protein YgcG